MLKSPSTRMADSAAAYPASLQAIPAGDRSRPASRLGRNTARPSRTRSLAEYRRSLEQGSSHGGDWRTRAGSLTRHGPSPGLPGVNPSGSVLHSSCDAVFNDSGYSASSKFQDSSRWGFLHRFTGDNGSGSYKSTSVSSGSQQSAILDSSDPSRMSSNSPTSTGCTLVDVSGSVPKDASDPSRNRSALGSELTNPLSESGHYNRSHVESGIGSGRYHGSDLSINRARLGSDLAPVKGLLDIHHNRPRSGSDLSPGKDRSDVSMGRLRSGSDLYSGHHRSDLSISRPRSGSDSTRGYQDVVRHLRSGSHRGSPEVPNVRRMRPSSRASSSDGSWRTTDTAGSGIHGNTRAQSGSKYGGTPALSQTEDLIHLQGPLTEDAVLRCLQARFYSKQYYTRVGPVSLVVNPFSSESGPQALQQVATPCAKLRQLASHMIQEATTGIPQTLVVNGLSGSGKTHVTMSLLRQLFEQTGGGVSTDVFKYLNASLTALRALGSAGTSNNPEASRMGYFIQTFMCSGTVTRTRVQCCLIDHGRVVRRSNGESNFHVFYQLLAGLTEAERNEYHVGSYDARHFRYLSTAESYGAEHESPDVLARFRAWKTSLAVLGIPLSDVTRVLCAVLLLGNVQFLQGPGLELEVQGHKELQAVASLLGVSHSALVQSLTVRSRQVREQVFRSRLDSVLANQNRDALAQALYARAVGAIAKRVNIVRAPSTSSANSSSSNDSNHQDGLLVKYVDDTQSRRSLHRQQKNPYVNSSVWMSPSNSRLTGETFVGVLDMFGFEELQDNRLEQLCINLCAETLQHLYNTVIFKTTEDSCVEEGIHADMDIYYAENAAIVELISSQRTGMLSLLDAECSLQKATAETYLQRVQSQHRGCKYFSECMSRDRKQFAVRHYAGRVHYDVTHFLSANRDWLPDDMVCLFVKANCSFGFVSHLFSNELKVIQGSQPQGEMFRIAPRRSQDVTQKGPDSTLSQDFHGRLESLLKTVIQTEPHFIRCFKSNADHRRELFERHLVAKQLRAAQVLETLHLMATGFPHKMKYRIFSQRYRILLPEFSLRPAGSDHNAYFLEAKLIMEHVMRRAEAAQDGHADVGTHWALGNKHVFISESTRQLMEQSRCRQRAWCVTLLQSLWRRRVAIRRWPLLRRQLELRRRRSLPPNRKRTSRPRERRRTMSDGEQPTAQVATAHRPTPSMDNNNGGDKASAHHGVDMARPPPLPSSRCYTVMGNVKMGYPQTRVMRENYTEAGKFTLSKGQRIKVIGASARKGHLVVENGLNMLDVPYHLTELAQQHPRTAMVAEV